MPPLAPDWTLATGAGTVMTGTECDHIIFTVDVVSLINMYANPDYLMETLTRGRREVVLVTLPVSR